MAHTHYKDTGKVHSFRGLLAHGEQRKIRIQGPVGAIAWRIIKLQLFPSTPGVNAQESVVKVYREQQDSITGTVDFTDTNLLGAAFQRSPASVGTASGYSTTIFTIFDNDLFSRNIFVTHDDNFQNLACNYYIELEEVKVGKAGMAQLAVAAARRTIG